ncbi:hypothetical protein NDU88_008897 [Pleurodeles waltl]|uniref:Uncharacterized protein n=1 Tax=Pleurodeles waltl TaxID=8319 RepID=A0AAV7RW48_PLEWA|nr:hypothetical protein NDU88_008897 [Pleurodeles waltl]
MSARGPPRTAAPHLLPRRRRSTRARTFRAELQRAPRPLLPVAQGGLGGQFRLCRLVPGQAFPVCADCPAGSQEELFIRISWQALSEPDCEDKFYSLTEDSEAISSGCNQSVEEGSTSSESESVSSVAGPKVQPQRRHRRSIKSRSGSTGGAELSGQSARALKWDYSGTRSTGLEKVSKFDLLPKADGVEDGQVPSTNATSTDTKMLQMIYDTIRELQIETRPESRRARIATKQLQGTVRKVTRPCTEIEEKLNAMEKRTAAVEAEVEALKEQAETQ